MAFAILQILVGVVFMAMALRFPRLRLNYALFVFGVPVLMSGVLFFITKVWNLSSLEQIVIYAASVWLGFSLANRYRPIIYGA